MVFQKFLSSTFKAGCVLSLLLFLFNMQDGWFSFLSVLLGLCKFVSLPHKAEWHKAKSEVSSQIFICSPFMSSHSPIFPVWFRSCGLAELLSLVLSFCWECTKKLARPTSNQLPWHPLPVAHGHPEAGKWVLLLCDQVCYEILSQATVEGLSIPVTVGSGCWKLQHVMYCVQAAFFHLRVNICTWFGMVFTGMKNSSLARKLTTVRLQAHGATDFWECFCLYFWWSMSFVLASVLEMDQLVLAWVLLLIFFCFGFIFCLVCVFCCCCCR